MNIKSIILLLLTVFFLNACSSSSPEKAVPEAPGKEKTPHPVTTGSKTEDQLDTSLNGTKWLLQILHGRRSLSAMPVSLHFTERKVSGSAGCNSYFGSYTKTSAGNCRFSDITLTEKTCQTNKDIKQERAFAAVLDDTAACDLSDDEKQLFLKDKKGIVLAMLTRPDNRDAQEEEAQEELKGTSWNVSSFSNGEDGRTHVLSRKWVLTAKFGDNGRFSGSGGCNSYLAKYKASAADHRFSFEMIRMTTTQCQPERIMAQEGRFMAALYTVVSYRIKDNTLTLQDAEGNAAVILKKR